MPRHESENGRVDWTHIVYVIELGPQACADHRSPCNGTQCGKTPVYVGESAFNAEERFANHLNGHDHNRLVQSYGRKLRPELAPDREFDDRREAEAVVAALAEQLRLRGYCVSGGH